MQTKSLWAKGAISHLLRIPFSLDTPETRGVLAGSLVIDEGDSTHRQRSVSAGAKRPWPDTLSACAAYYSTAFRDQLALPIASELDNQARLAHSRAIVPPKPAISPARRLYRASLHRPTCLDLVLSRLDSCVVKSKRLVWHHSDRVALCCVALLPSPPTRCAAPNASFHSFSASLSSSNFPLLDIDATRAIVEASR